MFDSALLVAAEWQSTSTCTYTCTLYMPFCVHVHVRQMCCYSGFCEDSFRFVVLVWCNVQVCGAIIATLKWPDCVGVFVFSWYGRLRWSVSSSITWKAKLRLNQPINTTPAQTPLTPGECAHICEEKSAWWLDVHVHATMHQDVSCTVYVRELYNET